MWLLACASPSPDTSGTPDTGPGEAGGAGELTLRFRYVVLADPHVSDPTGEHVDRLDAAVAWINTEAEALDLRLVLVVGDVAWDDGLDAAKASLDRLAVPYVPLNGDNEVHLGAHESYGLTFAETYAALPQVFEGWVKAPDAVTNPDFGPGWYHNLAFVYEGVRFVGLDFASRDDGMMGEFGDLNDFEGGTFPFFAAQVAEAGALDEDVVLFSHLPMHLGAFDLDEMERIAAVTSPYAGHVWADLAGHYHGSATEKVAGAGYDLYVTDATWDDEVELRLVEVWGNEARFAPVTETVVVPFDG